ncbi:MAG: tetratricopeptide repeat protein, partial [Leptolyngbyaceae cyanobacterium RM1_406_9]|nr:tetratricopeptide repeat protein [Leptolyngbyaceae cyanobacterium RM1_406_9]
LAISEEQLGENHPAVATRLNNLANLYSSQGRYAQAEPLYLRALAILLNVLGIDHPNSQQVWQNFQIFLSQAIQEGRTRELSDNPMTQTELSKIRDEE